jgi:hypothetical protein
MAGTPAALAANHYASGLGRVRDACPSVGTWDSYGMRAVSQGAGRVVNASRSAEVLVDHPRDAVVLFGSATIRHICLVVVTEIIPWLKAVFLWFL